METTTQTNASSITRSPENNDSVLIKAASVAHGAVDKVSSAAQEAARNAEPAIGRVAKAAHQVIDKAAVAVPTAEDLITIRKKLVDGTRRYVVANPLKAVAIAVVAGFLIGRIL